jgi:ion channel
VQLYWAVESYISRHRFVVLFGTLVAFYIVTPILHQLRDRLQASVPAAVEGILFLVILLGAVLSVARGRGWKLFALLLGLPAGALWLAGIIFVRDGIVLAVFSQALLAAFLGYVIWVLLVAIFDSQYVTFNTVCASLCIYLLLGLVWALVYSMVGELDPAAFISTVDSGREPLQMRVGRGDSTVLYFSFVTLTTLGYGDIVATTPISRMLASVEAITGQLYLAVLVARLVGMHIVHSTGPEQNGREKHEQ